MIISSGAHDTRVAILEDDQGVEIFIERENQRGVVGNIYKGRVSKVLPGMQSSFIDIGLERDAFLYVTEVINTVEEFEKLAGDDDEDDPAAARPGLRAGSGEASPEPLRGEGGDGNPDDRGAEGADGAEAAGAAPASAPDRRGRDRDKDQPQARIEDLLKEGQEVLVQ